MLNLKFQPMRTHYGPWQPCWISNQHQKHKYGRGPSSEHFWQVWLKSVQRFQRRRFKCESLRHTTDAKWWQKLTWPLTRWAKKAYIALFDRKLMKYTKSMVPQIRQLKCTTTKYIWRKLIYHWYRNRSKL